MPRKKDGTMRIKRKQGKGFQTSESMIETLKSLKPRKVEQKELTARLNRYESLLSEEDKETYKNLVSDSFLADMREEIALMRYILVKTLKGEKIPNNLDPMKLLSQLKEITQSIERLQRVNEKYWSRSEAKKVAEKIFVLVDSTIRQCPYCYMPLETVKQSLGEKILTSLEAKAKEAASSSN
jgi:hypothetical protein